MVPRRVVLRGAFAVGLLGATGTLTGCGDDAPSAGGAAPATDLTSTDAARTGRPTARPTSKSDVYQRSPEPRPARSTEPSAATDPATEPAATTDPTADPTAEPTAGSRGDDLATARNEPTPEPTPSPSPTPEPLPPGAVARTSDIPVGGGKTFPEKKLVVTQPTPGQFRAFDARCTHLGCLVDKVEHGQIVCPCHGSRFSIDDGQPEEGPALLPLAAKPVAVDDAGNIRSE